MLELYLALLKVGIVKGTFSSSHYGISSRFKPGCFDPPSNTLGGVSQVGNFGSSISEFSVAGSFGTGLSSGFNI